MSVVARLQREALALHCLKLAGFEVYLPRIRERRIERGRKVAAPPPLFPGYCFRRHRAAVACAALVPQASTA